MVTHSKTVPGNVIDIFLRKHDDFITLVEYNLDGLRFKKDTQFGFGEDDCLVAIDDVDIRKKSKDEISKLFNKEKLYDYNDVFKLTVVRKSHPDQSSIMVGNAQVQNLNAFFVVYIFKTELLFFYRFHQKSKHVVFVIYAMEQNYVQKYFGSTVTIIGII